MSDIAALPRTDRPSAPAAPRFLADVYDAASLCNKCSLCQAVCPTYVVNPVEWETARGRVSLVRDAIEGRVALADIVEGPLSTCLTCNNCVTACAPGVPTADIVTRARMEYHAQEGHPPLQSFALRSVLASPGRARRLHRMSRVAQRTGLHALARRTGLTRWMGAPGAIAEHAGPVPARDGYDRAATLEQPDVPRGDVVYLSCCYENAVAPEVAEATMRVLVAEGWRVDVPRLACSGLPAKTLGDRDAMLEMAVGAVDRLAPLQADAFVGDVASCTGQAQRYGELLAGDRLAEAARSVSSRTWQLSAFLARSGPRAVRGPLRWTVAFDEPCSLPLDQRSRHAPYRLLEQIPGLRLVPLHEAAMCCGGPGTYFHDQRERSEAILVRKFENVVASGADVLVTENISCLLQLRRGAREHAPKVRVMHLSEVLLASFEAERRREAVIRQR